MRGMTGAFPRPIPCSVSQGKMGHALSFRAREQEGKGDRGGLNDHWEVVIVFILMPPHFWQSKYSYLRTFYHWLRSNNTFIFKHFITCTVNWTSLDSHSSLLGQMGMIFSSYFVEEETEAWVGWDFPRTSQPGWYRVHTRSGFKERENGVRARHFLDGVPDGGLDQLTSSQGGAHSPHSLFL